MPQIIACGNCKTQMQVSDDAAGKQFRCPSCKTVFTVPATVREPVGATVGAGARPAAAPPSPSRPVAAVSKPAAAPPAAAGNACPACGSELLPGAVACMDCGFLIQSTPTPSETEAGGVSI